MSEIFCGIDPGTLHSGVVIFDYTDKKVIFSDEIANDSLRLILKGSEPDQFPVFSPMISAMDIVNIDEIFIEDIEPMGKTVGKSTFETVKWIGKFEEAYNNFTNKNMVEVCRGDEKMVLCGTRTFINPKTGKRKAIGDKEIKDAIIERFPMSGGGKRPQIGTKKMPGPLYGISGHCWQALAVLITGIEISMNDFQTKGMKDD